MYGKMAVPHPRLLLALLFIGIRLSVLQESEAIPEWGKLKCHESGGNGNEIGKITFGSQSIEFFQFSSDVTGYFNDMRCDLDWRVPSDCVVFVSLYPCHLSAIGTPCGDEVSIDAPQQGADPHLLCSGQGATEQPDEDAVHTAGDRLAVTFTTDSSHRAVGCGGFIAADCSESRKRKRRDNFKQQPSAAESVLKTALATASVTYAKNETDRQARLQAQAVLAAEIVRVRRAEREQYENETRSRSSRHRRSTCPCTGDSRSECPILVAELRTLAGKSTTRAERTRMMCDHKQHDRYCFDKYFAWEDLECWLCPELFVAAQTVWSLTGQCTLLGTYNDLCGQKFGFS